MSSDFCVRFIYNTAKLCDKTKLHACVTAYTQTKLEKWRIYFDLPTQRQSTGRLVRHHWQRKLPCY